MVINTRALLDGVAVLSDDHNIRVAVQHSSRGALICGASCFVGGLVAGPIGMAIGGTAGGVYAYRSSRDQFRSVGSVIREQMTDEQRERLRDRILEVAQGVEVTDLAVLLPMLMSSQSMQTAVLKTVVSFVTNEMKMKILD